MNRSLCGAVNCLCVIIITYSLLVALFTHSLLMSAMKNKILILYKSPYGKLFCAYQFLEWGDNISLPQFTFTCLRK